MRLAGINQKQWYALPLEDRARWREQAGVAGHNPTLVVTDGLTSSRPSVPRRARNDSLPRLARPPLRRRPPSTSINRRADHGPGFLYAMYDPDIYDSRHEIKLGLTTNLDRRLGQAHNLGDFRYLAWVPVSDMKNAESWLMRTYANECIENERFCIPSFDQIRSMLSLAASTFKADRALFVGLDSNHPEVTANG